MTTKSELMLIDQAKIRLARMGFHYTFQDVEADTTKLVNIGVVNLSQEANLRRRHRVLLGQEQLQLEETA